MDADTIYDVPLLMLKEKLDAVVLTKMRLPDRKEPDLKQWKEFLGKLKNPLREVKIGLVGKYNELQDAYKSIYEAFVHAGAVNECKVKVEAIHSEELENPKADMNKILAHLDGILVAPGFGERGIEGKYRAIRHCREHNIPFFGICLGMQSAVVEFARHVLNIPDAASTEVTPNTPNPIIDLMPEQKKISDKGGTMRLGSYDCTIKEGTKAFGAYNNKHIKERHRHRWEFNNKYLKDIEKNGMVASGINTESGLVEIVEIPAHKWFVGVQFHPELKSTPENPHPLFVDFVKSCL
jgi:CTP synthase